MGVTGDFLHNETFGIQWTAKPSNIVLSEEYKQFCAILPIFQYTNKGHYIANHEGGICGVIWILSHTVLHRSGGECSDTYTCADITYHYQSIFVMLTLK